jgi:3D (Asp-Asp-Asp) domain-containing protein
MNYVLQTFKKIKWFLIISTLMIIIILLINSYNNKVNIDLIKLEPENSNNKKINDNISEIIIMAKKIKEDRFIRKFGRTRIVSVTAYNSVPEQTDDDPWVAAWGDKLEEGMKIIAVSRDLESIGLTRGKVIQVERLGKFKVLDRMHERKTNQIDIYMGLDVNKAVRFGVKTLKISWGSNLELNYSRRNKNKKERII